MPKTDDKKQIKKKDDDWMTKKWRPMMAIMYMACCIADFVLFPIMFTLVQFWELQAANDAFRQWIPITLQGGGLFHIAMGAVLGVSAFGRSQEKIAGVANNSSSFNVPNSNNNSNIHPGNYSIPQNNWSNSAYPGQNQTSNLPFNNFETNRPVMMTSTGKKIVPEQDYPLI
jgi:hypothetical protein